MFVNKSARTQYVIYNYLLKNFFIIIHPPDSRLCAHKYASLFLRPISDEEAPGYSVVVKRPMDLTTIRRNIDNGNIRLSFKNGDAI